MTEKMSRSAAAQKPSKATKKTPTRLQKQRRRRMLSFARVFKYGVSNFSRNIWLTVAATAVMTVTLLIVLMTLVSNNILTETVSFVSKRVDMSMYIRSDAPEAKIQELRQRVAKLDNVASVRYISADEARAQQAEQNKKDIDTLEAIKEASNKMAATLRINLVDINDTTSLNAFVEQDELYKEIHDPSREPSFRGEKQQQIIDRIGGWVRLAGLIGGAATLVFVVISFLVVFNTIRMAIFNRRDEIQMMKLIGAERGFIRGPFLVEAAIYGLIAAVIATVAGYVLLFSMRESMINYEIPIEGTLDILVRYGWMVVLAMIGVGALIGIASAYIATRRYLKL